MLPHSGNEDVRVELTRFLQRVPNTVVLTMPTPLNRRIVDQDLSPYLVEGDYENGFRFLGKLPYQKDGQRWAFEHIAERNAITREVCASLGVRPDRPRRRADTANLPISARISSTPCTSARAPSALAGIIHDDVKDLLA